MAVLADAGFGSLVPGSRLLRDHLDQHRAARGGPADPAADGGRAGPGVARRDPDVGPGAVLYGGAPVGRRRPAGHPGGHRPGGSVGHAERAAGRQGGCRTGGHQLDGAAWSPSRTATTARCCGWDADAALLWPAPARADPGWAAAGAAPGTSGWSAGLRMSAAVAETAPAPGLDRPTRTTVVWSTGSRAGRSSPTCWPGGRDGIWRNCWRADWTADLGGCCLDPFPCSPVRRRSPGRGRTPRASIGLHATNGRSGHHCRCCSARRSAGGLRSELAMRR